MGRRRRQASAKGSTSLLMLLIIASAVLAFIPFRVTLAVGSSTVSLFFDAPVLLSLSGTHVSIDSLGLFLNTSTATTLLATILSLNTTSGEICLAGTSRASCSLGYPLKTTQYFAVKAQKITIDIDGTNGSMRGLLQPFGTGPDLGTSSREVVQVRVGLVSVTVSGYSSPTASGKNRYGEDNLAGLNPDFVISFDRIFLDLFIDPVASITTYIVSADMTVYQGIAMLAEAAFL